ncbi:MAG: PilZ domain-containing protein [Pseudomonadota bacterium]
MSFGNARAHPRYAVEVDAEVRFDNRVLPVRTHNVSRGGLCFLASEEIPLGQVVDITMSLVFDEQTFSEPLQVRARVVWCTCLMESLYQVGTMFFVVTNENRAYLEMFLRYLREGLARQAEEADARAAAKPDPTDTTDSEREDDEDGEDG